MRDCPKCGSAKSYNLKNRGVFRCVACKWQFSETSGTHLHAHKMPLRVYQEIETLVESGLNSRQIAETLGINPRTAYARARQFRERQLA